MKVNKSRDGVLLRLHLNKPEKRNALDDDMVATMIEALNEANSNEQTRAVLITAAGDHFCGGFDILSRNAEGGARPRVGSIQRRLPMQAHALIERMMNVQVPIVCAVRGNAAGIGLHLVAASDFAVASHDARFWEPFSTRGFTPDSAGTWLLPRRIGMAGARRLLLLGEPLSGTEAAAAGLVHTTTDTAKYDDEAQSIAQKLADGPTVALGLTKWLLHAGEHTALRDHLQNEALALEFSSRTDDFREGLKAMAERRAPQFGGR